MRTHPRRRAEALRAGRGAVGAGAAGRGSASARHSGGGGATRQGHCVCESQARAQTRSRRIGAQPRGAPRREAVMGRPRAAARESARPRERGEATARGIWPASVPRRSTRRGAQMRAPAQPRPGAHLSVGGSACAFLGGMARPGPDARARSPKKTLSRAKQGAHGATRNGRHARAGLGGGALPGLARTRWERTHLGCAARRTRKRRHSSRVCAPPEGAHLNVHAVRVRALRCSAARSLQHSGMQRSATRARARFPPQNASARR